MVTPTMGDDLSAFLAELGKETDRGLALVAAAVLDDKLREVLLAFFSDRAAGERLVDNADRALGTFSARIDACLALALIEEFEHHEITIIRKVRNGFAHARHGISFKTPHINSLCRSLRSEMPPVPQGKHLKARSMFVSAAFQLVVRLYNRPSHVARERRRVEPWIDQHTAFWGKENPARVEIVEINRYGRGETTTTTATVERPEGTSEPETK